MVALTNPLRRVRVSDETHRVTTFELFFDLVFVFAFTQVTQFMAHEHTAFGILQAMIILGLLWWAWASYSWLANQTHVDEGVMRIGMSVALIAMFVVALGIPEAFDDLAGGLDGPLVLVFAYLVVRLVHLGLYLIAAGDDRGLKAQVLRTLLVMLASWALLLTGALVGGSAQTWFWLAGLALDIVGTYLTSIGGNWRLHAAVHWTERYGLVVILALGESIVAIGVGAAQLPISTAILFASVLGIVLSVCLWWLYFDVISIAAERVLARSEGSARVSLAVDAYTYLHLALVAGVVISALGVEEVLAEVERAEPLGMFATAALFGGTSLYLAAHAVFWKRVGGNWNIWRLAVSSALLALIPVGALLPPLASLAIVVALAVGLVVLETTRYSGVRAEVRAEHA